MELELKGNTLIVALHGELDSHYADSVRNKVDDTAKRYEVKNIIFNLQDVTFMDSSGIGFIVGRYKYALRHGGITIAAQAGIELKKLLVLSGLHRIIGIYDNLEEAVSSVERRR